MVTERLFYCPGVFPPLLCLGLEARVCALQKCGASLVQSGPVQWATGRREPGVWFKLFHCAHSGGEKKEAGSTVVVFY